MKSGLLAGLAVGLLVAAAMIALPALRQRSRDVAANLSLIQGDTGDVMASASYQRYAARRRAVEQMRAGLRSVATVESVFVADSGRPTSSLLPEGRYAFTPDPANMISIEIQRDRWVAQAHNIHGTMSCSLTAMLDTTTGQYHPGEPVCAGWTAESIAVATAAAPQPASAAVAETRDEQESRSSQAAQPQRPHRDWGPVNNKPPRLPYIAVNTCEGEGCTNQGTWAACSTIVARASKDQRSAPVFTISPGERFTALTGDVHVETAGMVGFRHPIVNPPEAVEVDSIQFTPADTLYILNAHGEGYLVWYFRGQAADGYQFWEDFTDVPLGSNPADTAVLLRRTQTVFWVKVRNAAGKEGWIVGDYYKMATGGYMDEVERCLHTAKG